MKLINHRKVFFSLFLSIILILTACAVKNPTQTFPNSTQTAQVTPTKLAIIPTATPIEISQPRKLMLITNDGFNSYEMQSIKTSLNDYAQSIGSELEITTSFEIDLIKSSQLVAMINPEDSWLEDASQLTDIVFIVFSDKSLELANNSFQIKTLSSEFYFLAGYVSAVASEDWRVGALLSNGSINNSSTSQLFSNGMHFLCGLCFPVYTPLVSFPVTANLGLPSDISTTLAAYDEISSSRPKTVFIDSDYLTEDLSVMLKNEGITIISNQSNDPDTRNLPDIIIYQEISDVLSNLLNSLDKNPQRISSADLKIISKSAILSTGKLDFIQIVINDLKQGYIFPDSVQE